MSKFRKYIQEAKYNEGEFVIFDNEKFEIIEVLSNKKLKLISKDGKEIITVFQNEVKSIKE